MDNDFVVLDFGTLSTRILSVEGGRSPRVRDFVVVPHPRHASDDEKKALVRPALANLSAKSGAKAVLTWEEGLVFRQLLLPDMPAEDLKKAFLWEMKEKFLFSGEESFYASQLVAETSAEDDAREKLYDVFYCDRRSASDKIAFVESLGYRVSAVVPGQAAAAALVGAVVQDASRDVAVFDAGFQGARVMVVREGRIMLSRTVLLGGQALTDMMTASYFDEQGNRVQLGPAEAESLKISQGANDPQAAHIGLLRPYLEKVVGEIKRSVDYYEGQKYARPIAKAVFTGGGANLKGLEGYMSRFLGLEVAALPAEAFVSPSMPAEKKEDFAARFPTFAAAVGAATAPALNLLPRRDAPHARRLRLMSARLLVAVAAVLVLFWDAWSFFQLRLANSQLGAVSSEAKELSRVGSLVADLETQQRFMRVALKGDLSHPALLKALSRVTPGSMMFDRLTFTREDGVLVIDGTVTAGKGEVKAIAQFITDLLATPFFKEATLVNSAPENARLRFQIRCVTAGYL